jgi:hypothetical protein
MQDPMFSVEAVDAAVDYKMKYDELLHFIEIVEALTYDEMTSKRIGNFLKEKGIWT